MRTFKKIATSLPITVGLLTTPVLAETNMLFILDGSNSMWGQIDGVAKVATAKTVFANLLFDIPDETNIGLMAYGHRSEADCGDVELMSELGSDSAADLLKKVKSITPKGKTPIATALAQSEFAFASRLEENNNIILISDGVETCEGNPCDVAADLVKKGINVRVHVVGFDVAGEERQQLECIADAGNGKYFDAQSAQALQAAVTEVKQVAQAPAASPPEPEPEPEPEVVFFDDFDEDVLAEHWEVINPDINSYIVEGGELVIVSSDRAGPDSEEAKNLIRLTEDLPSGDYILSARLTVDFQTQREYPMLLLYDDHTNYVMNGIWAYQSWRTPCDKVQTCVFNTFIKRQGESETEFEEMVWRSPSRDGKSFEEHIADLPQPIQLRIVKKGREYTGGVLLENAEDPQWIESQQIRILRQKGKPGLFLYQWGDTSGESAMIVDWVKIEKLN